MQELRLIVWQYLSYLVMSELIREIVWVIDVVSATSFRMGLSYTMREK